MIEGADSAYYSFLESLAAPVRDITSYYHDLLMSMELRMKIRYKIPFFDHYSWICYLNPVKDEAIELAFLHGQELSDEHLLLQSQGRKQIAGITISKIREIPDQRIRELIAEAMVLDEYKFQQRKSRRSGK